ncbi:MAG: RsmF rRNA methyltransferase first C-terminal domain-containing protein [Lachnospirales bacterium]
MLPEKFKTNMQDLLKEDYSDYLLSFKENNIKGIRINNLKISNENFLNKYNSFFQNLTPVPWCDRGYYSHITNTILYNAGLYYIQEPSAMSVANFLPINEKDRILDLCAAPGGKTTFISDKLNNTGLVVANDISPTRCKALIKNIELMGIKNTIVTAEKPEKLRKYFKNYFNKILIDAPCSGEGMFRKDKSVLNNWHENDNLKFAEVQKEILEISKNLLCNNGYIVYSTCTFSPIENENIILEFLNNNPEFHLVPIDNEKYNFSRGLVKGAKNTSRLFPHKIKGEGHFLAILKRDDEANEEFDFPWKNPKEVKYFREFEKEYLNIEINGYFFLHEKSLFVTNVPLPSLKNLRVMRSGFYLGDIKNRFIPSQHLAMALNGKDFKNTLNLELSDPRIQKYLKGETLEAEMQDGWVLVNMDGYPLGFAKAQSNKLKNKLSKSFIQF